MPRLFTFAPTYRQPICRSSRQNAADYRSPRSRRGAAIRSRLPHAAPPSTDGVPCLPRALLGVEAGGPGTAALTGAQAPEDARRGANLGVGHADAYI